MKNALRPSRDLTPAKRRDRKSDAVSRVLPDVSEVRSLTLRNKKLPATTFSIRVMRRVVSSLAYPLIAFLSFIIGDRGTPKSVRKATKEIEKPQIRIRAIKKIGSRRGPALIDDLSGERKNRV